MNQLEEARRAIDHVDRQMAVLFEQRMEAVRQIAAFKSEQGLPILNKEREREVAAQNRALLEDPALSPYYDAFIGQVMEISRQYQADLFDLNKNNKL